MYNTKIWFFLYNIKGKTYTMSGIEEKVSEENYFIDDCDGLHYYVLFLFI